MIVYEISWKVFSKFTDQWLDYNKHYNDPIEARFCLQQLLTRAAIDPKLADITIKKVAIENLDLDEFLKG